MNTATPTRAQRLARDAAEAAELRAAERHAVHDETVNVTVHETGKRKLFADYLDVARANWTPGVVITPAWVRQVTACSRGLSPRLARALSAEVADDHQ